MATALHGWHPGEIAIQRKLGFEKAVNDGWSHIGNSMPDQHRLFYTSNLPFIPITTLDEEGRPWASIVAGRTGEIGFVKSPDSQTLSLHTRLWEGDPLLSTAKAWVDHQNVPSDRFLTAGIGIELSTRRRNKFAGPIRGIKRLTDSDYQITVTVIEAMGNCPKYINVRKLVPAPNTRPEIRYQHPHLAMQSRLPEEVIQFILDADTVFIGSVYKSKTLNFPSHAGMNARSGLPGFMRVSPSDGRTIVIPDYSGNRFVSSLGNIESSGLVGLTIVSFTTGDILYLTGTAENIVGLQALKIMVRHASVTSVKVTGFTFIRDAFPVRQKAGTSPERSPYSPKVKYLTEEAVSTIGGSQQLKAQLEEAVQLSSDLAVFKFKVKSTAGDNDLILRPGQAIVLDFMDWIGPPQYQHMANSAPGSVNDDRVRTWTVSSAHEKRKVTRFELTMREAKRGTVTGALFNLLRKAGSKELGQPISIDNPVSADIVGITGDFFMKPGNLNMLLIAGGIGITPFLAMLGALAGRKSNAEGDIALVLATREPDIMISLMKPALEQMPAKVKIKITIFTHDAGAFISYSNTPSQQVSIIKGRVDPKYWHSLSKEKEVFICGPREFGDSATEGLKEAGFSLTQIHREGFY